MATLDDFMAFNFCEDQRDIQERSTTTEYPYQRQFWESSDSRDSDHPSYWGDSSDSDDDY